MRGFLPSFSSRMAGYFGALFLVTFGILFYLWYFNVPQLQLIGAGNQRLIEATRVLETQASYQRRWIANSMTERRGDILSISEDHLLAEAPEARNPEIKKNLERVFERLQRAYPDRYLSLMIVDPVSRQIRASSQATDHGRVYANEDLIRRASQTGATELIEQQVQASGTPTLSIVRQIHAIDPEGFFTGKLCGILIAELDLQHLLDEMQQDNWSKEVRPSSTLIFDGVGRILTRFPQTKSDGESTLMNRKVAQGFEGTLVLPDAQGSEWIAVYRHLQLSGVQGLTLVHYTDKSQVLQVFKERANTLVVTGMLLSVVSLSLIFWAAQRLTQPLQTLASVARQLGAGDLTARSLVRPDDSLEIATLKDAFNGMAHSIEQNHHTLATRVQSLALAMTSSSRESEFKLRHILDNVEARIYLKDTQGNYLFANRPVRELWQASIEEIIGFGDAKFCDAETTAKILQNDQRVLVDGETLKFEELIVMRESGKAVLNLSTKLPLRNEEGHIYALCGVSVDITEQRKVEQDLRIAAIAFESQEGMYVADANWVMLRVNRAFTDITGYTGKEALGQMPHVLLASDRHDASFFAQMTQSLQQTGSWQGEVWKRRKNNEIFPVWVILTEVRNAQSVLTHFVASMMDITDRKTAEDEIRNLAFYDPLTTLPNRRLLMNRLELALASGTRHRRKGALLFVDLDDFKTLNDTLGHDTGDQLLQEVAIRLRTCTREGDTVARLGGDEFVVLLEGLSETSAEAAAQAEVVGEKILTALNRPYRFANYEHHSTPSIGITIFGEQQESIDEPLKRADLAMYQSKAAGRNTLRFFDPQMQAVVTARAALELGLREALAQGQFVVHYQAQVTSAGHTIGAEALVRWVHPQLGMVSPAEFIPLAEETSLILPLGLWVLETVCVQLAIWATQPELAHLTVAVNVSARQFRQVDFVAQVLTVLARTGIQPQQLKLELTEGLLIVNVEDVIEKMTALKAVGVGFSLDDFGTGYSSLSYLKRLPLDQLKIDQSFVRDILVDPNDAAIAQMVVALSASLGLSVIAEGVETAAQRDFLASQGCYTYQGYLFSRPLPAEAFERLLKSAQS